jgi:hypothetical protein
VTNQFKKPLRNSLQSVKPWLYLFYIWGAQLLLIGILDLIGTESSVKTLKLIILLAALLASLILLIVRRSPAVKPVKFIMPQGKYITLLPIPIVVGSLILLWLIEPSDLTLNLHVIRVLLLAFFYVLLGTFLGKQLVWLGLWLFTLTVVVSLLYLGYIPLVFEAMGGISLIVCGWLLLSWCREEELA